MVSDVFLRNPDIGKMPEINGSGVNPAMKRWNSRCIRNSTPSSTPLLSISCQLSLSDRQIRIPPHSNAQANIYPRIQRCVTHTNAQVRILIVCFAIPLTAAARRPITLAGFLARICDRLSSTIVNARSPRLHADEYALEPIHSWCVEN